MKPISLLCAALVLSAGWSCVDGIARGAESPVGIHLTGVASRDNKTWQFEIVMQGHDLYYRKEWSQSLDGGTPDSAGFYSISLDETDIAAEIGRSWSRSTGARGGGYIGGDGRGTAEVARRLWQGTKFRGVAADELRELLGSGHATEEFTTPISRDSFPLPAVIKWTDNTSSAPNKTTTYTIENSEFIYRPDLQFFADVRKEYFKEFDKESRTQKPAMYEPPSESQRIAADALKEATQNQDAAVAKLRSALASTSLDEPLGAWNQSVLLSALWEIRGMDEKRELVAWFYRALQRAPADPDQSRNGYLDHGPCCLLDEIVQGDRVEKTDLLAAFVADPRLDQADAASIDKLMEWSYEGFPIPKEIALEERGSGLPKGEVRRELLPLWRNILRRHYGLPEEVR